MAIQIVKEKETEKRKVESVTLEFSKEAKLVMYQFGKKDIQGINPKEVELSNEALTLRHAGKDYVFERGKKMVVPVAAARHWLGAHKVDTPLDIRDVSEQERNAEQRRVRLRFKRFKELPLKVCNAIFEEKKKDTLPQGTLKVG